MFSASIRPLRLKTVSPFAALLILSVHRLLEFWLCDLEGHPLYGNHRANINSLRIGAFSARSFEFSAIFDFPKIAKSQKPGFKVLKEEEVIQV